MRTLAAISRDSADEVRKILERQMAEVGVRETELKKATNEAKKACLGYLEDMHEDDEDEIWFHQYYKDS